ncbi:MAG: hypothetical protein IKC68_00120, partial [Bacteroidales bacterium]|nr:hypothetical protein [Bacteroidales bacterium]
NSFPSFSSIYKYFKVSGAKFRRLIRIPKKYTAICENRLPTAIEGRFGVENLFKNLRFSDKSLLDVIQTWDDALSIIITPRQPGYASDRQAANRPKLCLSLLKTVQIDAFSAPSGAESAKTLPVAPTRITSMTTLFGKIQCCGTMTHNAHHPADM